MRIHARRGTGGPNKKDRPKVVSLLNRVCLQTARYKAIINAAIAQQALTANIAEGDQQLMQVPMISMSQTASEEGRCRCATKSTPR